MPLVDIDGALQLGEVTAVDFEGDAVVCAGTERSAGAQRDSSTQSENLHRPTRRLATTWRMPFPADALGKGVAGDGDDVRVTALEKKTRRCLVGDNGGQAGLCSLPDVCEHLRSGTGNFFYWRLVTGGRERRRKRDHGASAAAAGRRLRER